MLGEKKQSDLNTSLSNHYENSEMVEVDGSAHGTIRQSFKYFHETEHSMHGPKGEERTQLVPYFL